MSAIVIHYKDLTVAGAGHLDLLKKQENAVRRAVAGIGRSCWVRWLCKSDALGHLTFRLVVCGDWKNCIAQFTLPDFDLDPDSFAKLITEGQRGCSADTWLDDDCVSFSHEIRCRKNADDTFDADLYENGIENSDFKVRNATSAGVQDFFRTVRENSGIAVTVHSSCEECFGTKGHSEP